MQRSHSMKWLVNAAAAMATAIAVIAMPASVAQGQQQQPQQQPARPVNVVVILADDLGYGDLGVQGGRDIPTPNIDSIATGGARFTAGYVSCPICAPTRAGLLTGRYPQRFGFDDNNGPVPPPNYGLEPTEATLAESFKAAGYATGMFGKWHIGERPGYLPNDRGFDEFFGFLPGANSYVRYADGDDDAAAWATSGGGGAAGGQRRPFVNGRRSPLLRNGVPVDEPQYLTEAFARDGAAFIGRNAKANKPFFVYLPFNAVHAPLEATDRYLARFKDLPEGRRTYAAMVSALDEAVGTVLTSLKQNGVEDNTIVFFTSDNGGPTGDGGGGGNFSSNTPLRGRKGTFWEGGVRVPLFVRYPGRVASGAIVEHPVISLDILPTALAAAGVQHVGTKPLDGKNLLPVLEGKVDEPPHQILFWRYHDHYAARDLEWKLIRGKDLKPKLFHIKTDVAEQHDVADRHPEQVARLAAAIDAWAATLEKPRWVRQVRGPKGEGSVPQPAQVVGQD